MITKICQVLNDLGVPFSSIIIFDGKYNAKTAYASYVGNGLPAGVVVSNNYDSLHGQAMAAFVETLGQPYNTGVGHLCAADIVNGVIDIVVKYCD